MKAKLVVFDLDGTLAVNPEFYRNVYSGTLEDLIVEQRGKDGLKVLKYCRENYEGKGELALFALNIPFGDWTQLLVNAPMNLLTLQARLGEFIRCLKAIKVVYTGSPLKMAMRILQRLGFQPTVDFNLIIGWQEPELFPLKWTCSPIVFQGILEKFSVSPDEAWAVGDVWDTDLMPAQAIGMKTAMVRKPRQGNPDIWLPTAEGFVGIISGEANHG